MREPTHPGQVLQHDYLAELKLTQTKLAAHLGVEVKAIRRLVHGHTGISPAMALRLGAALGTSPAFWMNLQAAYDLWEQRQALESLPAPLLPAS